MIVPVPIRRGQLTSTPCDLLFLGYKKKSHISVIVPHTAGG